MTQVRAPAPQRKFRDANRARGLTGLVMVALLYWLLAWYMERIELPTPGWWQAQLELLPLLDFLTPFVVFAGEMLTFRVLRHFFPVIVGWWLAYSVTVGLLRALYELPDRAAARAFLSRLQSMAPLDQPVLVTRQDLAETHRTLPLLRVGGPGRVAVGPGDAIVTEQNGRFHRILGPGTHNLRRFERVRSIVDLRPQEREQKDVLLITKDGIEIKADFSITYRVDPGDQPPTKARPYPFNPEAVRKAAYIKSVASDGSVSTWESVAPGITIGQLKKAVADYRLDELLYPDDRADDPHLNIKQLVESNARNIARNSGIHVTSFRLARLEMPSPVIEQRIKYWKTYWENLRRLDTADGEVEAFKELESARAQAEAAMIQAIMEGVHRAQQEGVLTFSKDVLALRWLEALERVAKQTEQFSPVPKDLLQQIRNINRQLMLEAGQETTTSQEQT